MRHRLLFVIGALVAVVVASLTPVLFARQTATTEGATPSRTSWGDPDLQGVWMATTPHPPSSAPQTVEPWFRPRPKRTSWSRNLHVVGMTAHAAGPQPTSRAPTTHFGKTGGERSWGDRR